VPNPQNIDVMYMPWKGDIVAQVDELTEVAGNDLGSRHRFTRALGSHHREQISQFLAASVPFY
jgi:hypothetical protein